MTGAKTRIALMIDGEQLGGAELSLVNLLRMPQTKAFEFVLVGADRPVVHDLGFRMNVETATTASSDPRGPGPFRAILKNVRPDMVQITLPNPAACVAHQLAAHSLRLPTILIEQLVRGITRPQRIAKAATARLATDHVAVGEASARRVERLALLPTGSVRTIYNGIPDDRQPEPRPPSQGATPGRSLVTVARLEQQKGLSYLLEAIALVDDVNLTLIGDGSMRSELEGAIRRLELHDRVEIRGWVEDPRVLLPDFDLFVLPSVDEAFPLTVVEAMLAGVPVLATDVGSVAEAVTDGVTGCLVAPRNPNELAAAIRGSLTSPDELQRWATAARTRARAQFTADAMADAYVDLWRQPRGRLNPRAQVEGIGSLIS